MTCLFCGNTGKMSREHLWPQWVLRSLDDESRRKSVVHSLHDSSGDAYKVWDARVFSATLNRVCPSCNNGWMSDLEARVQPIAEPLLHGETRILDSEAQLALSHWGYMKSLLFVAVAGDQMSEAMESAGSVFFELQKQGLLPSHVSMFTARHIGPRNGQYQHRVLGTDPDRPLLFVQTLTVLQLTVQVLRNYRVRAPIRVERHPAVRSSEHVIWPLGPEFSWPPGPGLDDQGLTFYTGPQPGEPRATRRARRWRPSR